MWEITKLSEDRWEVSTEYAIQPGGYDASGIYESKQAAIEAATLHGDTYIVLGQ